MSTIRIIATPPGPGFAPEEIRRQWVGVELPLATEKELTENPPSGSGIGSDNAGGYYVRAAEAVKALRKAGRGNAANFWASYTVLGYLLFKKEVCEMIK